MFYRIVLYIILLNSLLVAQGSWKEVTKMPRPVTDAQIIYNENPSNPMFYIIGGYSDVEQRTVNWIQIYNIQENSWRIIENGLNYRRKNFSAALWDTTIIIFGGLRSEITHTPQFELFPLSEKTTTQVVDSTSGALFDRVYGNCYVMQDTLYVFGGNIKSQTYMFAYDLKQKKELFRILYQEPEVFQDEMAFLKDGSFFIFGGVQFVVKKNIKIFSQKNRTIKESIENLIEPRAGGAAIYNKILRQGFVIGGYNEGKKALSTVEILLFSPDGTFKMNKAEEINYARKNPMAANYANTIFLFGGRNADDKVVSQVEQYISSVSDINDESTIPASFNLFQNYPNPFNPETTISYKISTVSFVDLKVYDILGKEVASLVNETQQPGMYNVKFSINSSLSTQQSSLSTAMYFYCLRAGNFIQAKKMLLLK